MILNPEYIGRTPRNLHTNTRVKTFHGYQSENPKTNHEHKLETPSKVYTMSQKSHEHTCKTDTYTPASSHEPINSFKLDTECTAFVNRPTLTWTHLSGWHAHLRYKGREISWIQAGYSRYSLKHRHILQSRHNPTHQNEPTNTWELLNGSRVRL